MTTSPHRVLTQLPLVCAILADIGRQVPGAFIDENMMAAIIRVANALVEAANAVGILLPQEPAR